MNTMMAPQPLACKICERISFLRCIECTTSYCSGSCQIKDWENHRKLHLDKLIFEDTPQALQVMADRLPPEIVSGKGKPMSVQERLNRATQNTVDNTNKNIQDLKLDRGALGGGISNTENLIKAQSTAKASMSASMNNLAKGIDTIQVSVSAKNEDVEMKDEACALSKDLETMAIDDVDEIDPILQPLDNYMQIIENFDRPIVTLHKYNRSAPIPPDVKDLEGFFFVRVTHIDQLSNGEPIFSLNLCETNEDVDYYEYYKQQLNINYSGSTIAEEIPFHKVTNTKLLYVAKFDNQWSRCRLISMAKDHKIVVDIDTGKRHKMVPTTLVKLACEPEMMKSALSFRVKITNLVNPSSINVNDLLKIKMIESNIYGISTVEAVLEETEAEADNDDDWKEVKARPKTPEPRNMINQIKVVHLPLGPQTIVYVDASLIQEGKIHVRENSPKIEQFYDELDVKIQKYIRLNPRLNNYKPVVGELVLAIYPDDETKAYRAVCTGASDVDCKIFFIDYGSKLVIHGFEDVWKMPNEFVKECLSVSVNVKLKSGKSLKDADVDQTMSLLAAADKIDVVVQLENDKHFITLDDSLVALK